MENENILKIEKIITNLENKSSRYYFLMPDVTSPNSSVYEIYRHASVLKSLGYNVTILTEEFNYEKPIWLNDKELTNVEHKKMGNDIQISPEDFIVIPEVLTNVMEKLRPLQCKKIVLLQSMDYALHSLLPSIDYAQFGIFDVITVSESMSNMFKLYFGEHYNVQTYNIGIPEYFKYNGELKKPIISFVARNGADMNRIVKLFYLKYPYFRFLTFQDLNNIDRKTFAEKLKESFALLWLDNISSASTVPLEAMKANCLPIGLLPNIEHDYINQDNGYWSNNKYEIPMIISKALSEYLEDEINPELEKNMLETTSNYTDEISKSQLVEIYDNFLNERIESFKNYLEELKNEQK
jgi:hypothetical protein